MVTRADGVLVAERGWPRLVLGDWGRMIRDTVDLVRLSYLGGAVWCLAIGQPGTALRFGLTFLAVLLPRFLAAPRLFDFFFSATLGLQAWGNLVGLFGHGTLFDREFAANRLGGQLFTSYEDTILDLIMDSIGALIGSAALASWAQAGWGSRRLPGRAPAS